MLLTATLCLLAFGAVMVFSASSTTKVLSDGGLSDRAFYLKRTLLFGAVGLVVMHVVARHGLATIRRLTPLLPGALLLPAARGARRRHDRQRRDPLDRLRLPPDPALGAGQGRADPLRRRPARRPSRSGQIARRADALPARRRRRLPADRDGARPRHDAGRRLRGRGDPGRRRRADPRPGADRRGARRPRPAA